MSGVFQVISGQYGYLIVVVVMMIGLYIVIAHGNLIKKLIGLNIFQSSVFMLFILLAAQQGAAPPIVDGESAGPYANPLPHVLILTAIVVSIATTALGLSLAVRVNNAWGTLEEEEMPPCKDSMD